MSDNLDRNPELIERSELRPLVEEMALDLQKKYDYTDSRVDWVQLNPDGHVDVTMTFIDSQSEKEFKTVMLWDWDKRKISMPGDDELF